MSIRALPHILAAAVSVALGFTPAIAQQPPQSLRLYVLDCGIITPPNVDNYGLKPNDQTLPEFLMGPAKSDSLTKFIAERQDMQNMPIFRLAS
jgi:hypothetical protein